MSDHGPGAEDSGDAYGVAPTKKRSRLPLIVTPIVLVLAAGAAFVAVQVNKVTSAPYKTVTYAVPEAPHLIATPGESVYRIDPSKSSLSYKIHEKIAGRNASTAIGTTNGIAGDIAVNRDKPAESRMGKIVANVEQFHSDNRLRDARIRSDFLESHQYPLATFEATTISGLPSPIPSGSAQKFTITGTATVHGVTKGVTWQATGTLSSDSITVDATTKVKLPDFGIDSVSIAGLVSAANEAELTMKLVAVDPGKTAIPTRISGPDAMKVSNSGPSYSKVIEPILADHCSSCHKPGEVGAAHWKLDTASDAGKVAEGLETVTAAKYMPPWPASDKGVPLAHPNKLTTAQIDAIAQWARTGGKLDVPGSTKVKETAAVVGDLPRQDVKLHMSEPYTGSNEQLNDYRCFVLDPKVTSPTFLTGYTFLADQVKELHHAQVFLISAEQKENALKRSGKDGKPGWQCFGTVDMRGKPATGGFAPRASVGGYVGQSNLVAGWVPGQTPVKFPAGSGVMFEPGDALVLQIHYHFDSKITPDQSGIALQLDPGTANLKKIRVVNPLAPVEIPCAAGVEAKLCDRQASLEDNVRLYGPMGALTESALLSICGHTPEELAARFNGQVASSDCTMSVPESGTIYAVLGHMHTLGKTFRLTLDPGTPKQKILLDIPTWNFDWQMNYGLATPLHVDAGEKIKMECSWDRSIDPNRAPKYIVFADGTEDEMCFGTYAMIPDNQS